MHNCKSTKNSFIDLMLGEIEPARARQLQAELKDCPGCHEEYESLRSTLHVSNQALRSAVPGEEFWPGYRTRLHSKLLASPAEQVESAVERPALAAISLSSQLWLALKTLATTSVRIPVPAALALLLVFGVFFFVLRGREQVNVAASTPVVLEKTNIVRVPVIQEKVVTRVVYVEKRGRRSESGANLPERTVIPNAPNSVAVTGANSTTALSLVDFKPTNEVKLTVIKGSYKDEKR
jgi:anti-sigma factor RsiW